MPVGQLVFNPLILPHGKHQDGSQQRTGQNNGDRHKDVSHTAYENIVLPVRLDGKIEDQKFLDEIVHFLELEMRCF